MPHTGFGFVSGHQKLNDPGQERVGCLLFPCSQLDTNYSPFFFFSFFWGDVGWGCFAHVTISFFFFFFSFFFLPSHSSHECFVFVDGACWLCYSCWFHLSRRCQDLLSQCYEMNACTDHKTCGEWSHNMH